MLIKSLEQKTKLALMTVVVTVIGCTFICGFTVWKAMALLSEERDQIYVLDGDIPFLAERAELETNFLMEAKAHIQLFHHYFFNLPPDDDFIKWTIGRALYMADGTALKQKQALEEKGFYSDLVASSAICTIKCDSIVLDENTRQFIYYGTQKIKRRTRDQRRTLITTGNIENVQRSAHNPHGLMITHWKTIENKDLEY